MEHDTGKIHHPAQGTIMELLPIREFRPIQQKAPKKKARGKLAALSEKGMAKNREYAKKKKAFLIDHPYCQHFMAENGIDEDVAKKGRGKYHLDTSTWMATRSGHSTFIHGDPKTAYAKGYMLPR
jgi:hypothetical protein